MASINSIFPVPVILTEYVIASFAFNSFSLTLAEISRTPTAPKKPFGLGLGSSFTFIVIGFDEISSSLTL